MKIDRLTIEGFTNIEKIELKLTHINALIAFNNYGKSNVMRAIDFGVSFIKASPEQKMRQMGYQSAIPINKSISDKEFSLEIDGSIISGDEEVGFVYKYSFEWLRTGRSSGRKIKSEILKIKKGENPKYTTYLQRSSKGSFYLSSPTGRCDKPIPIENNNLIVNKIANFDELFYVDIIKQLISFDVMMIDTMQKPSSLFRTVSSQTDKSDYSLSIDEDSEVGFFVYSLMKLLPDTYELFKDTVKSLLPTIEDFNPIEINLKEHSINKSDSTDIPFSLPEKFYDIRVKESYNNQETSINSISDGSKKIFYVLAMSIGADINKIPLVMFEELENSIHPALFQKLLITLNALCENTKMVISSHSPYLIKYLHAEKLKIGIPNNDGIAMFKSIKASKISRISKMASEEGVSIGDYVFSLMLDASLGDSESLNEICS
ncbi:MAG: AAA family ATPase [Parabacteroides sp.]|jgi:predicted ATPase|nr:AAA family ATPase [Paludibacter sp.]MBP7486826.1 AAA family ATPase [Parabacteroides sp.]MDD4403960.1 AAA family ATPase [Parabacteroides sp.]